MPKFLAHGWTLREISAWRGYCVECVAQGTWWLSRRNRLYSADALEASPVWRGQLPAPRWRSLASHSRAAQRALRFSFYNVLPLADGRTFVTFDRTLGLFDRSQRYLKVDGYREPARVLRGAAAIADDGSVLFGEYRDNAERRPIRVYRLALDCDELEVIYEFPAGEVRHVHGIYRDPFDGALWCVCGDRDSECRILRTTNQFGSIEVVGSGDESWRTVSLLFTSQAIYYATDAEFAQNSLFKIDRATRQRVSVCDLDGPVYYSTSYDGWLLFGVTAELCPSQCRREASLWAMSADGTCDRVLAFEKDWLSVKYFQAGTWSFPRQAANEPLVSSALRPSETDAWARTRRLQTAASNSLAGSIGAEPVGSTDSEGMVFSTVALRGAHARVFVLQPPAQNPRAQTSPLALASTSQERRGRGAAI